jgi:hypothetical protein
MRKLFFVVLLTGLAILLASWSFSGQTTIHQGPIKASVLNQQTAVKAVSATEAKTKQV